MRWEKPGDTILFLVMRKISRCPNNTIMSIRFDGEQVQSTGRFYTANDFMC